MTISARNEWRIAMSLLAAQALLRLALILHTGPMTDQDLFGDDSYMSHQFAWSMAHGRGIVQGGAPTNGFQPLFVFLLVPLYWVFDKYTATMASAGMSSLFGLIAAYLAWRIARMLVGKVAAMLVLVLWLFSPYWTQVTLNGLETSLANMLLLGVVWLHLSWSKVWVPPGERDGSSREGERGVVHAPRHRTAIHGVMAGLLMGLMVLGRLDTALLLVPLGLDYIRQRVIRREYPTLLATMLTGLLVIGPWFVWSKTVCGTWSPVSGSATRTGAMLFGEAKGPSREPRYFSLDEVPSRFYQDHLAHAFRTVLRPLPLPLGGDRSARPEEHVSRVGWMVGLLLIAGYLQWTAHGGRFLKEMVGVCCSQWYLWVFALLLVGSYSFYFFAQWHFWRYMTPIVILMLMAICWAISEIGQSLWRCGWWGRAVAMATLVVWCGMSIPAQAKFFGPIRQSGIAYNLYHDAVDLRLLAADGVKIGSVESGTLDYFIEQDVINLDGKTNVVAHRAMLAGKMDELLVAWGIDYVVSSPLVTRDLVMRRGQFEGVSLVLEGRLRHNWIWRVQAQAGE